MIRSLDKIGDCDFCGNREVYIYDLQRDQGLDSRFNDVISIFKLSNDLPNDYPPHKLVMLKDEFANNWNIFNGLSSEKIYTLLKSLLEVNYSEKISLLNSTVGILEFINEEYLNNNSLLKNHTWEDFVNYLKHINRFHLKHINLDVLSIYIERLSTTLEDDLFYRARISNEEELDFAKMGAPPARFAKAGRANSEGISHLYLASDIETVIKEIRPSSSDCIFIGRFPVPENTKVVDFRILKKISVFDFEDPAMFAINIDNFNKMSNEISKPVRSGDSKLDYLPTQFIVDFIKSRNETLVEPIRGIVFDSTLSTSGYNLMIFNPEFISCNRIIKKSISEISYSHIPIED
ncbi:RES family NAD+ phosphorylase [Chungangia koreensis]|uniref:RES family NAD+ phosphorylase n=1 Tax=Chungangia koreensis TaxID=752657 RepID=A0ABV8X6C3_9LACT